MLQESDLILVGNIFPISVMLPILAELMGIITLFFARTEIHADAGAVLQRALVGQCFGGRSPLLHME